MQETLQNPALLAEEVARLREQMLDLGGQVVTLTEELAATGRRYAALEEGLRRVGDVTGLPLLPPAPKAPVLRARRHGHLTSLPGGVL